MAKNGFFTMVNDYFIFKVIYISQQRLWSRFLKRVTENFKTFSLNETTIHDYFLQKNSGISNFVKILFFFPDLLISFQFLNWSSFWNHIISLLIKKIFVCCIHNLYMIKKNTFTYRYIYSDAFLCPKKSNVDYHISLQKAVT